MNFQNVINKYHYEGLLAEFLPKVYQELINLLGEEYTPIIYEAFFNTEIIIANNVYDGLIEKNMYEKGEGLIVKDEDLKRASGDYKSIPEISFDGTNFKIEKVKRIVVISSFIEEYKNVMLSIIIHELGHLVKSYYNEYKIEGNLLISYSGLIKSVYELEYKNGKVVKRLISEQGVGFEEGLNTVLEVEIGKKLIAPNWEEQGYKTVTSGARNFYNTPELKRMIIAAQMKKEREQFIASFNDYFMEGAYEELEKFFDKIYSLCLQQMANALNPDKMDDIAKEIYDAIISEHNPLIKRMDESRASKRN